MGVRYSYGDFTTRGHGVIEYADLYSNQGGQRKKRIKSKSRFATRWPSPAPLKIMSPKNNVSSISLEKRAWKIFKKRYPGQQPKKGQIKLIMKELGLKPNKTQGKVQKLSTRAHIKKHVPRPENTLDKLAKAMFIKRYPDQHPTKDQLADLRREIADARSKLGL